MRTRYTANRIKEYMSTHQATAYIAVIDHKEKIEVSCESEAEAIALLRKLVEQDGKHVFIKQIDWNVEDVDRKSGLIFSVLQWINVTTGKTYHKTIKLVGYTWHDIKA